MDLFLKDFDFRFYLQSPWITEQQNAKLILNKNSSLCSARVLATEGGELI